MSGQLRQAVVYFNPSDHPGSYVVRGWTIEAGKGPLPDGEAFVCPSLDTAREQVELMIPGGFCLARSAADDPTIVEVWL